MTWAVAFEQQAAACTDLGSPFTGTLLRLIAERALPPGAIARRITGWPGDIGPTGASVPLRLAGALHGLVIEARAPALAAQYPAARPETDPDALWRAVQDALTEHEDWLLGRLDLPPQTNECARSAALILAANWLARQYPLPLDLSELGASAGLNLMFDRFALIAGATRLGPEDAVLTLAPEWRGAPMGPGAGQPQVAVRAGADLSPLDPIADRARLLSYIWADQPARFARMQAALDATARARPKVAKADAIDWLAERLSTPRPGHLHLIYHTVAWQYFPAAAQARGEALLAKAGARATPDAPLARFAMENDGHGPGAALTLTLWPGGETRACGRFDFHGRWIDWREPV